MNLKHVPINYELLAQSIKFYESKGYEYVQVPWIVEPQYSLITNNNMLKVFDLNDMRHLVGSAEQAFLKQMLEKQLSHNIKYMAVTPCFRKYEDDELHSETFIKLELFKSFGVLHHKRVSYESLENITFDMCADALENFINLSNDDFISYTTFMNFDLSVPGIEVASKDIENKSGIEMGSYGYRYIPIENGMGLYYEYGTGIALPRFQLSL